MEEKIYVLGLYSKGLVCSSRDIAKLRDKLLRFYFKDIVPSILDKYKGQDGNYIEEILADISCALNENYIDGIGGIYETEII